MSHTDPPPPKGFGATGPPPPKSFGETGPPPHDDYGGLDSPEVASETGDVDLRPIVGFAVGLFVVTAVVFVMMYGLFWYFDRQAARKDPAVSPLARPAVQMPRSTAGNPVFGQGQGPQLLTEEPSVLAKQRQTEQDVLESYGWVDEKSAIVRIPISEAKKLILQRGLPARADGADQSLGTRRAAYGESSSGRTITHPPAAAGPAQEPPAATPGHAAPEQAPKGHGQ
jgi:hypothetical protein